MTRGGPGDDRTRTSPPEAATEGMPGGLLSPGQVLGERYQILEALGRGGMGEVWRAFDLKLRVEVALKALRADLFRDEKRLEMLRSEVRAAREVVSQNVCRIFDLIEADGSELVSMEYVDGQTLLEVLQERGPLELKEAQDLASQFLAGLEAIHKAGLVHRDVKPENIMVTRAGRVVVMDFGLARQGDSGAGTVAGTPAYMAPEQAAGLKVDARADVYSAGVVLAEMVSPDGIKSFESRQSLWEGVRSEPAKVPETPWAPVLRKAVAKEREQRYRSAHTLTRALEEVTLRVEGAEDLHPYPGLASFTEADAEYFFGREAEVEQMWRRLQSAHLLAIVGPSGAGKTSFIAAGLVPGAPSGWQIVRCTPGNAAMSSLATVVAREMAGDADAVSLLPRFDDADVAVEVFTRWRKGGGEALLVVDQFEELFTQNSPDVQARFAGLLGRLVLEANIRVLLSMRDDFLMQCKLYEALQPIFASLIPLMPPAGANLRRALVQPATKCGYRFEDDELVDEMLAEVEGERGALPLLAFAAARLWEKRDRENGLLTRTAFHDIGGVGGALARHAEETIDRIGANRVPIVRELFRNLVTAEGTRAVREWDELLSVFGNTQQPSSSLRASRDPVRLVPLPRHSLRAGSSTRPSDGLAQDDRRGAAEEVLRALIDARLLTSYEVHEEDREPTRRVEIIHESLLANWPRLVRWQTQDQEGAQLRDELRQAARAWDEHGRHDDRLWTGTAYREFRLWQERYPGGLTEVEQAFAEAMISLAGRRRRRRRIAAAAALVVLVSVAVVFAGLWRKSVMQERRAEAQQLIALGQVRLEDYPTAALAYATASLELADSDEARFLALEALWDGPTAFIVNEDPTFFASFSPGGNWLVQSRDLMSSMVIIASNGHERVVHQPGESGKTRVAGIFGGIEDLFFAGGGRTTALWSAPESRMLASFTRTDDPYSPDVFEGFAIGANDEIPRELFVSGEGNLVNIDALHPDGNHERLGMVPLGQKGGLCIPTASTEWLGVVEGNQVSVVRIGRNELSDRILLGRYEGDLLPRCAADPMGRFLVTATRTGEIKLWDVTGDRPPTIVEGPSDLRALSVSKDGAHLSAVAGVRKGTVIDFWVWSIDDFGVRFRRRVDQVKAGRVGIDPVGLHFALVGPYPTFRLWWLGDPAGAEPVVLRRGPAAYAQQLEFSPDGRWLATSDQSGLILWPLVGRHAAVIRLDLQYFVGGLTFGPGGEFLATSADSKVILWPLEGTIPPAGHTVFEAGALLRGLAVSPNGELFAVGHDHGEVWIGRDDGEGPRQLPTGDESGSTAGTFSPDGRLVASLCGGYDIKSAVCRVWDVESSDEIAVLGLSDAEFRRGSSFTSDGRLLTGTSRGVMAWDVETGERETLVEAGVDTFVASADGRKLLVTEQGEGGGMQDPAGSPIFFDLSTGDSTVLTTHGSHVVAMALDQEGTLAVTGDSDGVIRVGAITGEVPHLLLGHESEVLHLAIDPLGRWIASGGQDGTVRLWPMPDLSKPPLHTLPREELIAKLKTLTNLRVVRDPESATGWTLTHDPFPGWETVPTW